jgi:hypothetical protein
MHDFVIVHTHLFYRVDEFVSKSAINFYVNFSDKFMQYHQTFLAVNELSVNTSIITFICLKKHVLDCEFVIRMFTYTTKNHTTLNIYIICAYEPKLS